MAEFPPPPTLKNSDVAGVLSQYLKDDVNFATHGRTIYRTLAFRKRPLEFQVGAAGFLNKYFWSKYW